MKIKEKIQNAKDQTKKVLPYIAVGVASGTAVAVAIKLKKSPTDLFPVPIADINWLLEDTSRILVHESRDIALQIINNA